jgi:uncharacterized protein YjaG (DUF416 family)
MLAFDKSAVVAALSALPRDARLAFSLSCAERLYPNYLAFSRQCHWGNAAHVRAALDAAWDALAGTPPAAKLRAKLIRDVQAAQPNTEDFDTVLVSSALDAASTAELAWEQWGDGGVEHAAAIASLCVDTVDMYVQELEQLDSADPELETKIRQHPLMQRELARQAADLDRLRAFEPDLISELRRDWHAPERSNLGLP